MFYCFYYGLNRIVIWCQSVQKLVYMLCFYVGGQGVWKNNLWHYQSLGGFSGDSHGVGTVVADEKDMKHMGWCCTQSIRSCRLIREGSFLVYLGLLLEYGVVYNLCVKFEENLQNNLYQKMSKYVRFLQKMSVFCKKG